MPVKWNAELDQVLLVKILDTCDIKPSQNDYKSMADTWPAHLEKPTPRAISEHLWKIRAQAKATMNGSGENADGDNSPKKASPQKKKTSKASTKEKGVTPNGKGATGAGQKRKRGVVEEIAIESDDDGVELAVKIESTGESEHEDASARDFKETKRVRVEKVDRGRSPTPRVAQGAGFSAVDGKFEMEAF